MNNNKAVGILSYLFWIVALILQICEKEKGKFGHYHLEQGFGLILLSIVYAIIVTVITMIIPAVGMILWILYLAFLVLMIIGIINAVNEKMTPLPLVGKFFEGKFNFLP